MCFVVDTKMTTTPTQRPEAIWLADALDELDAQFTHRGMCGEAAAELRRQHAEIERLTAENEALRAKMALVDYVLQDDIHNRLTPRVVDIAYSAFMIAKSGKNKDDGGPCDWFNDTKPMVMEQLAKTQKHLVEEAAHGIGKSIP